MAEKVIAAGKVRFDCAIEDSQKSERDLPLST